MHEEMKKVEWLKGNRTIATIANTGIQRFWETLANHQKMLELTDRGMRCMDEGTPGGVRLAGSGILLGLKRAEQFARSAMEDGGLDFIGYHLDCGAAASYSATHGGDSFANAKSFAEELADRLGIKAKAVLLERPIGLHLARVVYYDVSGRFDPSRLPQLPKGFVVSRKYHQDPTTALWETEMAISIALGSHGFGDLFDQSHPLFVVPVADKKQDLHKAATEIKQHLLQLPKKKKRRIRVDALLVK